MEFKGFLVILILSVIIVAALRRFHFPPVLGYLMTGCLVGPGGIALLTPGEDLSFLAEFGVVFLLFTIGLELSLPKLISMRRTLLGLGGLQVVTTTLIVIFIAEQLGLPFHAALPIGGALALSSTAVVTKQLVEQSELHSLQGRMALSILLFQDLAAVPFLIIVPTLGSGNDVALQEILLLACLKGVLVFAVMLAAGRWLLRPLFHVIAAARSSELFMLTTLLVVLSSAWITESLHLSMALGAFLAGVMLAETEYQHQIESDIQPFRDVLLGLFFLTIGMMLDPQVLVGQLLPISLVLAALLLIKGFIIAVLSFLMGARKDVAIKTGIFMAQGGEFGFAFLSIADTHQLIAPQHNQIVIAAIVLSIAISPLLIRNNAKITKKILSVISDQAKDPIEQDVPLDEDLDDHVIICGYGRVGQTLARFLDRDGIPYIGLDLDPKRLKEALRAKEPVMYGDSTRLETLMSAGLKKAQMLIISFNEPRKAKKTIRAIRQAGLTLPILVRAKDDSLLEALLEAGATEVIPEILEASLMLASHMLLLLGQDQEKIQDQIAEVKATRYHMLRAFFKGGDDVVRLEQSDTEAQELHAVDITTGAYCIGKTIQELLAEDFVLDIAGFQRDGYKSEMPAQDTELLEGDVLILRGTPEELHLAEERLLQG